MEPAKRLRGLTAVVRQRERDPEERRNGGHPEESAIVGLILGPWIRETVKAAVKEAMVEALSDTWSRRAWRWTVRKLKGE